MGPNSGFLSLEVIVGSPGAYETFRTRAPGSGRRPCSGTAMFKPRLYPGCGVIKQIARSDPPKGLSPPYLKTSFQAERPCA